MYNRCQDRSCGSDIVISRGLALMLLVYLVCERKLCSMIDSDMQSRLCKYLKIYIYIDIDIIFIYVCRYEFIYTCICMSLLCQEDRYQLSIAIASPCFFKPCAKGRMTNGRCQQTCLRLQLGTQMLGTKTYRSEQHGGTPVKHLGSAPGPGATAGTWQGQLFGQSSDNTNSVQTFYDLASS